MRKQSGVYAMFNLPDICLSLAAADQVLGPCISPGENRNSPGSWVINRSSDN